MTGTQAEAPALPANDELAIAAQAHAVRIAVREYHAAKAKTAAEAARQGAQPDFAAARNRGMKTTGVVLPDGTEVGTLSIYAGEIEVCTREEELILCARPDELEEYVLPAALHDPRALKLLADFLPELVGRRIELGVRAAFETELRERGGTVADHNTGDRETVATITRHDATGRCQYKPGKQAAHQIAAAIAAGQVTEDGRIVPAPAPQADAGPASVPAADERKEASALPPVPHETPRARKGDLTPTGEQAPAIEAFASGVPSVVVEAGAGTGKTSLLIMAAQAVPGRSGSYLCFNAAVAAEARRKFPPNTDCSTIHSVAMAAVGRDYAHRLNGPRIPAREQAFILRASSPVKVGDVMLAPTQLARLAMAAVERYCRSADEEVAARHVAKVNGLEDPAARSELAQVIVPLARRAWADLSARDGRLKFDHDHYRKIWALGDPVLPGDFVFYDEAQDTPEVNLGVLLKQRDLQVVAVGDRCQAINAWAGAIDAMDKFPAAATFSLEQSFRFGSAIAGEANKVLTILGARLRLRGLDRISSTVRSCDNPDAILCRTNAGAMGCAMRAMDQGRKVALLGGGKAIRALAEAADDLRAGRPTSHPELFTFRTWGEVQDHAENDAAGADLRVLVSLIDEHGPEKIIAATDALADEKHAGVVVGTAHKVKGREWDSVRIEDFRPPRRTPDRPDPEMPDELAMLLYVAFTRARLTLDRAAAAWVDDFLPGGNR
jgi:hypothetical protein